MKRASISAYAYHPIYKAKDILRCELPVGEVIEYGLHTGQDDTTGIRWYKGEVFENHEYFIRVWRLHNNKKAWMDTINKADLVCGLVEVKNYRVNLEKI